VKIFRLLTSRILLIHVEIKNYLCVIIKMYALQNNINTKLLKNFEGDIQITEEKLLGLYSTRKYFSILARGKNVRELKYGSKEISTEPRSRIF